MESQPWESKTLDRHSPIPLYHQLSDLLMELIKEEKLQPGVPLPSENDLMRWYGVSRHVVRQTLNNLSRQGIVDTEQGRGSFVSNQCIEKPLDILQSYHKGMRKSGLQVEVKIISKTMIKPPGDIASLLGLDEADEAFYLERVAYLNDRPINILISYISPLTVDQRHLMQFTGGSLYGHLEEECQVCLYRSQSYIEIVYAKEHESRLLNMARGTILLQISGIVYDKNEQPVEYSRVIYPGNRFRFRFDSYMGDERVLSSNT
jgi:GntR family transcriptional regulator